MRARGARRCLRASMPRRSKPRARAPRRPRSFPATLAHRRCRRRAGRRASAVGTDEVGGVGILLGEDPGPDDHGDLGPEAGEGLPEFTGDRAAANDGQPRRQVVEFPDRFRGHGCTSAVQARDTGADRCAAGGDQGLPEADGPASTSATPGARNVRAPLMTSLRLLRAPAGESTGSMVLIAAKMRFRTSANAGGSPGQCAAVLACSAADRRVLDGTHPVHRQSPPVRSCSTRTVRAPNPAAVLAPTIPAVPPPTTRRSTIRFFGCHDGLLLD